MFLPHARKFFRSFYIDDELYEDYHYDGDGLFWPVNLTLPIVKCRCDTSFTRGGMYEPPNLVDLDHDADMEVVMFKECCAKCAKNIRILVLSDGSYEGSVVCDCVCELGESHGSDFGLEFLAYCERCYVLLHSEGTNPAMIPCPCASLPFDQLRKIRILIADIEGDC